MCAKDTVHVTPVSLWKVTLCIHLNMTHGKRTTVRLGKKRQAAVLPGTDIWDYEAMKGHVVVCLSSGGFVTCGVWAVFDKILERSW